MQWMTTPLIMIFFHLIFLFCSASIFYICKSYPSPVPLVYIRSSSFLLYILSDLRVPHGYYLVWSRQAHYVCYSFFIILYSSFSSMRCCPCTISSRWPPILHIRGIRTFLWSTPYIHYSPDTTFYIYTPDMMNKASETCVACHISM